MGLPPWQRGSPTMSCLAIALPASAAQPNWSTLSLFVTQFTFVILSLLSLFKETNKKTTTKPPTPGYTMVCLCLFVFFFFVVVCLFVLKNQNKQTMASHPQQPMGGVSAKTKKFHMSPLVRFWQGFFWGHSCAREAHRADDRLRDRLWKLLVENYPITPLSSPS